MFTFDGPNKLIDISGTTEVDVQELYSSWKEWVLLDNANYYDAFRTFGGDPTITGQFAPSYYFLQNGWRVNVLSGQSISFGTNLYTEEGDSPFIVAAGSDVTNRNSDAVIVDNGVAESLDYFGVVNVDAGDGMTGTTYPIGTTAQPVSNISDAIAIAEERGLHNIRIHGTVLFNADVDNYIVEGGNLSDIIVMQGNSVSNTTFKECVLAGTYTGFIAAETCQLADGLSGGGGAFKECGLLGSLSVSSGGTLSILNSSSMIPGNSAPSVYLSEETNFNLRKYSGGLSLYNSKVGCTSTLEFIAGKCTLDTSNVSGEISVRGIVALTDNSNGAAVDTNGLVSNIVWNEDVSSAAEGTAGYELVIARLQAALAAALSA